MITKKSLILLLASAALFWSGCVIAAAGEKPLPQPEAYQQRLVDWIRSDKNGFFHEAVVWKRLGPDGKSGPYAMHTTRDIPKGETLLVVPRSYTIDSFKTFEMCTTIARMLHEYHKGDDSFYAPYLSYLFDDTVGGTSTGLLPSTWTDQGKDLLYWILGDEGDVEIDPLEPYHFDERSSVFEECGTHFRAQTNDGEPLQDPALRQQAEDAMMFYISRSWTDKMIPILDMYNHRNGASKNVESKTVHHNDNDIVAYASRNIKAGEQLQNTYTECMDEDCNWGGIQYDFSTQSVLVDYGFVELYPRRWDLGPKDENNDHDSLCEVDQDLETGEKTFRWIFHKPSPKTLSYVDAHLKRLKSIEADVREKFTKHRSTVGRPHNNVEHEADCLLEYYEAYVEALELALKHKDDPIGVTMEAFEEHLAKARAETEYEEL